MGSHYEMKRTENTEKINEYLQSSTECFRTNNNVDQNSDPGTTIVDSLLNIFKFIFT